MNDYDAVFATVKFYSGPLASPCHKAIYETSAQFDPRFPGWPIYRRLIVGDALMDKCIEAFFIGTARRLARAQTKTGRQYISESRRRNDWIAQAGRDAMDFVLFGRYAENAFARADHYGISHPTYRKIRNPLGRGIRDGMDQWIGELHYRFSRILFAQKLRGSENDLIIDGD